MSLTNKHAFLIGINDIEDLTYLSTPVHYACKMQQWAATQGYQTHLFVDEDDKANRQKVRLSDIYDSVERALNENPEQLLFYFAGHGVQLSSGDDIWLLPGYKTNLNQTIGLFANKQLAFSSGVRHVVFISDACRTVGGSSIQHASGSLIIPKLNKKNYEIAVDIFYSTWPGEPSTDLRDAQGHYKSIYSDCLLNCLTGQVEEVIRPLRQLVPGFPAVISRNLNNYLKREVPKLMLNQGGVSQQPFANVDSDDPVFLSRFANAAPKEKSFFENEFDPIPAFKPDFVPKKESQDLDEFFQLEVSQSIKEFFTRTSEKIRADNFNFKRSGFASRNTTGYYITGDDEVEVYFPREAKFEWAIATNPPRSRNFYKFKWRDRFPLGDFSATIFIGIKGGKRFYPVMLLPFFICHVSIGEEEVISIDYLPTRGRKKDEADLYFEEIVNRKAIIVAAAKKGVFQGSDELADYVRKYKSLDPILGLFASYAYFQHGKYRDVQSIFSYMNKEYEPVLNDVVLLNFLSGDQRDFSFKRPIFPMLTEGWSYLKILSDNRENDLANHLCPGLWASFDEDGMRKIVETYSYIIFK